MASGDTGNVVPRKGLWVRVPCPPLLRVRDAILAIAGVDPGPDVVSSRPRVLLTTFAVTVSP